MNDLPEWIWAAPDEDDGWRWPKASKFPMQGQPDQFAFIREDAHKAALERAEAEKAAAVLAERERCARIYEAEADKCDDAAKWGGSKQYISDCKAAAYAMRDRAFAIRKGGEG